MILPPGKKQAGLGRHRCKMGLHGLSHLDAENPPFNSPCALTDTSFQVTGTLAVRLACTLAIIQMVLKESSNCALRLAAFRPLPY